MNDQLLARLIDFFGRGSGSPGGHGPPLPKPITWVSQLSLRSRSRSIWTDVVALPAVASFFLILLFAYEYNAQGNCIKPS